MKILLVAEYRDGKLLTNSNELIGFAETLGAESAMVLIGGEEVPTYAGKLYLADVTACGECNPDLHKQVILEVIDKEQPDMIAFCHSSYGWDLAPRVAFALKAAQVSEVVAVSDGKLVVPVCNAKLRRTIDCQSSRIVATLQAGAFGLKEPPSGTPDVIKVDVAGSGRTVFRGYEAALGGGVDLSKAAVIVSAGRGIGKADNVGLIVKLAKALGGEYGASRPVVDSEWVPHDRQVGTTGQTVAPKLYVACGISGAIQHLAGMKKSDFIVAINTDRDAPIGEEADVLVVADLLQFVPVLTEKIQAL
ncbi:electron transfer flavoprotein subunit alpha/FixB family protein [Desulfopila sp. IMCC35006]|uniref:electron transfer flavoprotein subunit alpha/FixB family protein n=1 Tax=Desulfopila sp. IMCC35006 TaxID=2569542 RepID=UPI0010ABD87E|nr:electron transfer flavoprotein subunit alpha/FixB family protein [Desulfopila sp. IMCC35006]TKB24328.1 electron transfer flavoprotein subunit alpha/FixB family protein [Desulfopila sp. IMCC35006]